MTTHHNTTDAGAESFPPELVPIARALDRLAALDRAAMPDELAQRIAASTAAHLMAREVSTLDALSTSDRSAASSTLEDRVFMATRAVITRGPSVRVHEPAERPTAARPRRMGWNSWGGRLAIAAGLVIATGLALLVLRNSTTGTPASTPTPQLASAIQNDLDALAAIIDTTDTRDDVLGLNVALRSVEDAIDDDPLKSTLDDGGAL